MLCRLATRLSVLRGRFNTATGEIIGRNQLLNPSRLIAGQLLSIVSRTGSPEPQQILGKHHIVGTDETLLTIAARYNVAPQAIAAANLLTWPTVVTPGQTLRVPASETYEPLPDGLTTLAVSRQPFQQGEAFSIYLETTTAITPTGSIQFTDLITPTQPWYPAA